jgi:hypothetical protein
MLAPADKSPPPVLAVAKTYDELHAALRNRAEQLAVSRAELDYLTGLQSGYCGKLLSKTQIKNIGPQSLGPLLTVLGLCLQVVEDPAAMARIGPRLKRRNDASVRYASGKRRRKRPKLGPQWARLMNAKRTLALSPMRRTELSRQAARVRWRDVKAAMAELKAKNGGPTGRAAAKPKQKQMTKACRENRLRLD